MIPGTFLCDDQFKFSDGQIGKKILVILNNGKCGHYLVAKTTSRRHYRSTRYGCQLKDRFPNFFLPEGSCCLNLDTWIGLDEFFIFKPQELLHKRFAGQMRIIGTLQANIFLDIVKCVIRCDDIPVGQIPILEQMLESSEVLST